MLNRNLSRQCRRIVVQSKETLTGPWSAAWPSVWLAAETRGSIAARQAGRTLPWIGVNDSAEEQRLQADHAARLQESAIFRLGWPEKLSRYQWYMDDGDIMCHPILMLPLLQDFVANEKSRSGAEPTENRSHLPRERSGRSIP